MAPVYTEQLLMRRSAIQQRLDLLGQRLGPGEPSRLAQLKTELGAYWDSMDPILTWTPEKKAAGHSSGNRYFRVATP